MSSKSCWRVDAGNPLLCEAQAARRLASIEAKRGCRLGFLLGRLVALPEF
jgi:hypothetical protein